MYYRNRLLTGVLILFLFFPLAFGIEKSQIEAIDGILKIYQDYGQFNGSVLVAKNGKIIFKKGYGYANMEWGIPNTSDTKFRLGSITKQFTAMLVLQLVEKGKIKLTDPMIKFLPYYRKDVGDKVTIHQLLNHTSGIPSYTGFPGFFPNKSRDPYRPDDFIKKFCSNDLEFEPGSRFKYNNSGYFILGAIIEKVSGKTYGNLLSEKIFKPLGMKVSGYDLSGPVIKKRAAAYEKSGNGYVNAPYLDMSIPYAAGSLYSTVEDLYIWDRALYTGKLLSEKLKKKMFTPYRANYAYGWMIQKRKINKQKKTIYLHGGGINGFNTLIVRYIDDQHLIVLLNNTGRSKLNEMAEKIKKILYDQKIAVPKKPFYSVLLKEYSIKGAKAGETLLNKMFKDGGYDLGENVLNRLGYELLGIKKVDEAVSVFLRVVQYQPKSANAYDSLAEAYLVKGDKKNAAKYYKKAFELNPRIPGIIEKLEKLGVKVKGK